MAALGKLLSLGRKAEFTGAQEMDKQLTRMIAEKHRMHGTRI